MSTESSRDESPERADFRAEVRAFLEANAEPTVDRGPFAIHVHTSEDEAREAFEKGRRWQQLLAENDLAGITYPREYGGRGGESWMEAVYRSEARHFDGGPGFLGATILMLGPTLMAHASEEQKREYLPRLLSGQTTFCQLFSEPGAGSDLAGLACRAEHDGDEFVVNGQKVWNSSAQFCDWGMLLVRTDPDAPKHRGITFILVDMSSPGIEVRPLVQPTGGSEFNEVFFNDVRIPVANVIGEVNDGWVAARTVMANESALIGDASGSASTFEALHILAQNYGRTDDPVIRQGLAEAYTNERVLSIMGAQISDAIRRRTKPPLDPALMKLFVAEAKAQTGDLGTQIAGMASTVGESEDAVWTQFQVMYRYMISIGGGTNEVQRNNIGERSLGLPKEPGYDKTTPWKDIPRN